MIYPRNALEEKILKDPIIQQGLKYGRPRDGHPEGSVENHVIEILKRIDLLDDSPKEKDKLRIIGIFHDSVKYRIDQKKPKVGDNNHGVLARRIAEKYISDSIILDIIELHDAYYYMWIRFAKKGNCVDDDFNCLVNRFKGRMRLYLKFMLIDGTTGDKDIKPRIWFYEKLFRAGHLESNKPARF